MVREVALYEIPKTLEVARVLDDSVLEGYNDSVKSAYNSNTARAVLSQFGKADGELAGSNPFMLVQLINSGLLRGRIATRPDLETARRFSPNIFSGNYIDFGLALRTAGDSYSPNDLLAKTLAEQLARKGIRLGKGKLIPVSALTLVENADSTYGLVFGLNDSVRELEDLAQFKWDYKKQDGLARAVLVGYGGWVSDYDGLDDSGSDGRVVVVSGEATAKNFLETKLAGLQKQRDAEIAIVQARYVKALNVLRGE